MRRAIFLALLCLAPAARAQQLERITTAVPWPRGTRCHDGKLVVLARGIHRSAGGPQATIDDKAGCLFVVDPHVSEPVVKGQPAGDAVRRNASMFAPATSPPFRVWDRQMPPTRDAHTDRPYCMLVYDEASRCFFVCGYSGIDLGDGRKFRKNATDSILRYDLRDERWHVVEAHDPDVVPADALGKNIDPRYYPHHDPADNPPPHGLVNGPCGAVVAGRYLYVGAKDNTALARYDLKAIRARADAPPPPARLIFSRTSRVDDVYVQVQGHGKTYVEGVCALAVRDGWLYVAFRTTSQIIRFPLRADGSLVEPLVGQLIARFPAYDPKKKGGSANIYDMAFDRQGRLYVSPAYTGAVYRFRPDPKRPFDGRKGYGASTYVDLRALTDNPRALSGNIALDDAGNLYICSGNHDDPNSDTRGTVYRYRPPVDGWVREEALAATTKLNGCAVGDLDPRHPGNEIAAVGANGDVYVIHRDARGVWHHERVARLPGEAIQCAIGDLDPTRDGQELIVVGMKEGEERKDRPGAAHLIYRAGDGWQHQLLHEDARLIHGVCVGELDGKPGVEALCVGFGDHPTLLTKVDGAWKATPAGELPGAGKTAVPYRGGAAIACASGALVHLKRVAGEWKATTLDKAHAGQARIATDGARLLTGRDDGGLGLFASGERADIHNEPQKLRGAVLADLDPASEGLEAATASYLGLVTVLRKTEEGWRAEAVFHDTGKFHHLAAGPLPGIDKIALVACGYSRRLTVIYRQ